MLVTSNEYVTIKFGLSEEEYFEFLDASFANDKETKEIILKYYSKLSNDDKELFRYIEPRSIINNMDGDYVNYIIAASIDDLENIVKKAKNHFKKFLVETVDLPVEEERITDSIFSLYAKENFTSHEILTLNKFFFKNNISETEDKIQFCKMAKKIGLNRYMEEYENNK